MKRLCQLRFKVKNLLFKDISNILFCIYSIIQNVNFPERMKNLKARLKPWKFIISLACMNHQFGWLFLIFHGSTLLNEILIQFLDSLLKKSYKPFAGAFRSFWTFAQVCKLRNGGAMTWGESLWMEYGHPKKQIYI